MSTPGAGFPKAFTYVVVIDGPGNSKSSKATGAHWISYRSLTEKSDTVAVLGGSTFDE
jgi:hypothetical protein